MSANEPVKNGCETFHVSLHSNNDDNNKNNYSNNNDNNIIIINNNNFFKSQCIKLSTVVVLIKETTIKLNQNKSVGGLIGSFSFSGNH